MSRRHGLFTQFCEYKKFALHLTPESRIYTMAQLGTKKTIYDCSVQRQGAAGAALEMGCE